ncbi:hypothetical protein EYF80_039444 [Liparis tanakae]|uniref:Uncharacterized protein n=1 Tax=Liparis tanakae TaxID=230148 RepID=A0A4Z2GCK4_9TELE|nr:hypothetical protein EYF80_039444 [Liparis tanakae]
MQPRETEHYSYSCGWMVSSPTSETKRQRHGSAGNTAALFRPTDYKKQRSNWQTCIRARRLTSVLSQQQQGADSREIRCHRPRKVSVQRDGISHRPAK